MRRRSTGLLTKTASPTTYTAAGQVITYTYVISDTRGTGILQSLTDDKVSNISCPSTVVPYNGTLTCTGTYTIQSADAVPGGSVTNHATAVGDACGDGCIETATAQATVNYVAVRGSITIVATASGGDAAFGFTSSVSGASSFSLTTSNGSASRSFPSLLAGTYTFAEADLPTNWKLTSLICSGDTGGTPTSVDFANRSASVGLDPGEAIVCTFANAFDSATPTSPIIRRFLAHRVSLLSQEPDRSRFLRRIPGSLWSDDGTSSGVAGYGAPFSFTGNADGLSTTMAFSTSLAQMRSASAQAAAKVAGSNDMPTYVLGYADPNLPGVGMHVKPAPKPPVVANSRFDIWLEAHYMTFGADTGNIDSHGNFGILYLGADYLFGRSVLAGALVQFDWMKETSSTLSSWIEGHGTMAGPYVSTRLTPHLFFDTRVAWGLSTNHINPFGTYTDLFSTSRWLAHAKLTGNWHWGNDFRITPSMALDYVQEHQRAYVDLLGATISAQTVTLGRFSFGPEIARRFVRPDGTTIEPFASLTGEWDFERPQLTALSGASVGVEAFHAKVEAGVLVHTPGDLSMRLTGIYDGIGNSGFHAYGGEVWINVPLN